MNNSRCKTKILISETLIFNLLLSFSGGFQDAYTYLIRDKVFANAQTGNIVLISTNFISGQWQKGLRYLFPILAFILGILCVEMIRCNEKKFQRMNWKQLVLIFQCLIMLVVGFVPQSMNLIANILVSFSCAMQVQTFRKFEDNVYASTMCIGNLRSGTECLSSFIQTRDKSIGLKCIHYFSVIITFAIGSGACVMFSNIFLEKTIWGCLIILSICFLILRFEKPNHS